MANDNTGRNVALGLGVGVAALLVAQKIFFPKDPIVDQAKTEMERLAKLGIVPSRTPYEMEQAAKFIETKLAGTITYTSEAETKLKFPINKADVIALIEAYGSRPVYVAGFINTGSKNLVELVALRLSAEARTRINSWYAGRNINFRF